MVDYFRDMSHGKLDLSESEVFGWFALDKKHVDYPGITGRRTLIKWARTVAMAKGGSISTGSSPSWS